MAKGKGLGKILKVALKGAGKLAVGVGKSAWNALKSLTESKPEKEDTKVKGESPKVTSEVKNTVDTKPESDKLAEQDNRTAEAESKASKSVENKNNRDKSTVNTITNRTKSILQNYGLKGELVKSVKNSIKNESHVKNQSTVYNKSDIYNIYQHKDHSVSIDKAVMMLAANNDILANVNETLKLIHNQGSIEIDYKKIKSETAKVLSEKAKDESNSTNKATSKVTQKMSEIKIQEEIFRKALMEAKDPDQVALAKRQLELLAGIKYSIDTNGGTGGGKDDDDDSGLLSGVLSLLPSLLSFIPGLASSGLKLAKGVFSGAKSMVGKGWDALKGLFGKGSESTVKATAETAAKAGAEATAKSASKSVAKSGVKNFFKKLSPRALKVVTKKLIAKAILKNVAKGAGKLALKKIPIAGAAVGLGLGIERCMGDKPDYAGAALDITSGIASIFPGIGTGISAALDVAGITRDVYNCIDDMKEGNVDPNMFDDDDLSEILVEPTEEEMQIHEAQEKESSKQNWIDAGLAFIPIIGPVAAGLRSGYRYLRKNGMIEGSETFDNLSGYSSIKNAKPEVTEEQKASTAISEAAKAAIQSAVSTNNSTQSTPSHNEAKTSDKRFKGVVSTGKSKSGETEVELSDAADDFSLSAESKAVMDYWKDHQANPTDPEAANRLVDYWKSFEGKLGYSQYVRDINKGSTDCSGMVMNSMQNLFGMDITDGSGTCAAALATNKIGAVVTQSDIDASGGGSGKLTDEMIEKLQPGDVIYTRLDKWRGKRPYAVGHASLYIGDGKVLSQGGAKDKGPYETPLKYYDGKFVLAKRYFGTGNAEITKTEIEGAKSANVNQSGKMTIDKNVQGMINVTKAVTDVVMNKSKQSTFNPINNSTTTHPNSTQNNNTSQVVTPVNNSDSHNVTDNSQQTTVNNYTYNIFNGDGNLPDQTYTK